jgi:hypothetical protein
MAEKKKDLGAAAAAVASPYSRSVFGHLSFYSLGVAGQFNREAVHLTSGKWINASDSFFLIRLRKGAIGTCDPALGSNSMAYYSPKQISCGAVVFFVLPPCLQLFSGHFTI